MSSTSTFTHVHSSFLLPPLFRYDSIFFLLLCVLFFIPSSSMDNFSRSPSSKSSSDQKVKFEDAIEKNIPLKVNIKKDTCKNKTKEECLEECDKEKEKCTKQRKSTPPTKSFIESERIKRNIGIDYSKSQYTYNPSLDYTCNNIHVAIDNFYSPSLNQEIMRYTEEKRKEEKGFNSNCLIMSSGREKKKGEKRLKEKYHFKNEVVAPRGWGYEVIQGIDFNDKQRALQAFYDNKDADINFQLSLSEAYGGYLWTKWICRHIGDTAMHLCIKFNRFDVFKCLLVLNPNLKLKNEEGKTVADLMKEKDQFKDIDLAKLVESERIKREAEREAAKLELQRKERSKMGSLKTNILRKQYLSQVEKEAKQILFYGSHAVKGPVAKRKSSIVMNQKDSMYLPNIPIERQIYFEKKNYPQRRYYNNTEALRKADTLPDSSSSSFQHSNRKDNNFSEIIGRGVNSLSVKSVLRYEYINEVHIASLLEYIRNEANRNNSLKPKPFKDTTGQVHKKNNKEKETSRSKPQTKAIANEIEVQPLSIKKLIFSNQRMHDVLILPLLNGIVSSRNNPFTYIDLSCNCLTDSAGVALARILRLNKIPTKEDITFPGNDDNDSPIKTITGETLAATNQKHNHNDDDQFWGCTSLILTGNRISDDGIISILSTILNSSYKVIETVSDRKMTNGTNKNSVVSSNTTTTNIDNEREDKRLEAIKKMQHSSDAYKNANEIIHVYTPMKRINLKFNHITWKGELQIKEILKNTRFHSLNGEDLILLL